MSSWHIISLKIISINTYYIFFCLNIHKFYESQEAKNLYGNKKNAVHIKYISYNISYQQTQKQQHRRLFSIHFLFWCVQKKKKIFQCFGFRKFEHVKNVIALFFCSLNMGKSLLKYNLFLFRIFKESFCIRKYNVKYILSMYAYIFIAFYSMWKFINGNNF